MENDLEDRIFFNARKAWCTWSLGVLLTFVYFYSTGVSVEHMLFGPSDQTLKNFGSIDSLLIDAGDWTRLFRSLSLHGDLLHLMFNILVLIVLGRIMEGILWRAWLFLLFLG